MDWPLLAPLTEGERGLLLRATRRRGFSRGEVLFHEGDPADALHLVVSGHLLVHTSTSSGERTTLNVLAPGDIVGELALVDVGGEPRRSATVTALDACETQVLSGSAFRDLCRSKPAVVTLLVTLLAARIRELSDRLVEATCVSVDRRLYRRLLELDALFGTGVGIPLTQEQLADLAGGTRPTVNQALRRLTYRGVIETSRGRVLILDTAELERLAAR